MTSERHQQICKIYHSALELESQQRAAFLDQACDGDETLRKEVQSLIASHEGAGSFLDAPAIELAAEMLVDQVRSLEDSLSAITRSLPRWEKAGWERSTWRVTRS